MEDAFMNDRQFVAVIGGGSIGSDPLGLKTWSGISYSLFSELQRRQRLRRSVGIELPRVKRGLYIARNFHPDRASWRMRFQIDIGYLGALTREVGRRIEPDDNASDFLQIGAKFNTPKILSRGTRCFSYHDGCVAEAMRRVDGPKHVSADRYRRAIEFEKQVYLSMTKVFVMSKHLRNTLIRDFDVPTERISVLGAGVNLNPFPDFVSDKPYESREVLFIGADFARKGGWQLLDAFKIVRQRYPDARLHIVGPANLEIPQDLHQGVEYHGFLSKLQADDNARLQSLFRRCSLSVLPSLYEPFGLAPLESMAHQMPSVASNTGALPEFVIPGKTGELAEPGNVEDLAAKISQLIGDPDALRRMGEAGRQMVVEQFTWIKVVDRFLKIVSET
jgi:glycosyltransferase involved in cell wall biosynthesis